MTAECLSWSPVMTRKESQTNTRWTRWLCLCEEEITNLRETCCLLLSIMKAATWYIKQTWCRYLNPKTPNEFGTSVSSAVIYYGDNWMLMFMDGAYEENKKQQWIFGFYGTWWIKGEERSVCSFLLWMMLQELSYSSVCNSWWYSVILDISD